MNSNHFLWTRPVRISQCKHQSIRIVINYQNYAWGNMHFHHYVIQFYNSFAKSITLLKTIWLSQNYSLDTHAKCYRQQKSSKSLTALQPTIQDDTRSVEVSRGGVCLGFFNNLSTGAGDQQLVSNNEAGLRTVVFLLPVFLVLGGKPWLIAPPEI